MADMELVTSHQARAHITVDQVRDLFAGLSGDISGVKFFPNLGNKFDYEITDVLELEIKTGQGLAGGFFFQLLQKYTWTLDPGAMGYSRIDMLYLVIYEDTLTNIQSIDFVYEPGLDYPNGQSGVVPAPPSGGNVRETFPFYRANVKDGSILSIESFILPYLNNQSLETTVSNLVEELETNVGGTVEQVSENTQALNGFRFGIDQNGNYGYIKVGADSVTPFRQSQGTATAADVKAPKTFSNASGDNIVGTMPDRGAINGSVNPGVAYVIPEGYHNGQGRVTGNKNTGTYNFQPGSTGTTVDMGDTNLNRYVNAAEVRTTGRKDQSNHTITAEITGMTSFGFVLTVLCDGVPVTQVNASGTIGEVSPGSGQYSCNLSGSFVGKTSYSGGLKV